MVSFTKAVIVARLARKHLLSWLLWEMIVNGLASGVPVWGAEEQAGVFIPIRLTFPDVGFASVGVFNDQNEMVRSLSFAKPVQRGEEVFAWDGTTDLGLPAPPGSYRIHGVWFSTPPKATYVMKVGLSGNPPYLTDGDRGGWGGNLGPPMDICANRSGLLAVFLCVESSKETGIQMMDFDGNITRRFNSFFPWDGRLACAMDDKNAYLAISQVGKKHLFIGKYVLEKPPRGEILCDIPAGDHFQEAGFWKGDWTVDVRGLALSKGRLYVPVCLDDKLFVVDIESGKVLSAVTVSSPRGVTAFKGNVFLLSRKSLLLLDAEGNPSDSPLISDLDDPSGVATDTKGNFYITDGGASQQVKIFTSEGKPFRIIGLKGGRARSGPYDPAGLLDPRGLCVAADGRVWVTSGSADFQEITVWNPDGTRNKVFYNCGISSGQGRLSPDHSELLVGNRGVGNAAGLTAYKMDWENKSWAPSWHIGLTGEDQHHDEVLLGTDLSPNNPHPYVAFNKHSPYLAIGDGMVRATNGLIYIMGGEFSIWLFDPLTKAAKLASLVYTHRVEQTRDGRYHGFYNQGPNNWLTWSDLNNDGRMSLNEVTVTQNPPLLQYTTMLYGYELEPDLSILILAPTQAREPSSPVQQSVRYVLFRLPPKKLLPGGVPVYDWGELQRVVELQTPDYKGGDGGWKDPSRYGLDQFRTINGAIFASFFAVSKTKVRMSGVDGDGWWASRNWRLSPMKFDFNTGQPAWLKLGHRAAAVAKPGEMYYPGWGMAGSIDGIDFCADSLSQVWSWTDDGLFLGRIYNDNPSGTIYDSNGIYVELTGSFAYKIKGKTYLLTGDHGVSVHQIEMPLLTKLNGGSLELSRQQSAQAKPWDPDGPLPGKRPTYIARSIYDFDGAVQKNIRTITVDGKIEPEEWEGVLKQDLMLDKKKVGTLQVTFDKVNLYLAYDIEDPNGLKNDGHELPYAPFVSGSYVDFDLGRDWSIPNREENLEGDVRVILARISGGTPGIYQMGFWPVKRNLSLNSPKQPHLNPQDLLSPVQQRHFDDISPIAGLTFSWQMTKKGYTLEVSTPFAALGLNPLRQSVIGFDASVGFSDLSGQVRERATHWSGESETTVVDRPGSAELKPQTWGTLQFDPTPLAPVDADTRKTTTR